MISRRVGSTALVRTGCPNRQEVWAMTRSLSGPRVYRSAVVGAILLSVSVPDARTYDELRERLLLPALDVDWRYSGTGCPTPEPLLVCRKGEGFRREGLTLTAAATYGSAVSMRAALDEFYGSFVRELKGRGWSDQISQSHRVLQPLVLHSGTERWQGLVRQESDVASLLLIGHRRGTGTFVEVKRAGDPQAGWEGTTELTCPCEVIFFVFISASFPLDDACWLGSSP